jgi:hypothetical protein
LVQDIEANYQEMKAIVGEISSEARKRVWKSEKRQRRFFFLLKMNFLKKRKR